MATSRVGGTKGKLTGQVGNTIYQVRRNDDGTYTQIVYNKGERTETTITPKLQAQRMCTAMVESLMRDLRPVATISFQSGKNKSQSLNAFSSANLRVVKRDCMEHWYGNNRFVYPRHYRTDIDIQDLGGLYMISSGTLQYNLFDAMINDDYPQANWLDIQSAGAWLFGVKFYCEVGHLTVEEFRRAHKMTVLDKIVFCGLREWMSYVPDPDDPTTYVKHSYIIASQNMSVPSSAVMTPEVIRELFKFQSDMEVTVVIARNGHSFGFGRLAEYQEFNEYFYYDTAFSISQYSGRKLISDSHYHTPDGVDTPWLLGAQPCHVFGTWMGEPQVDPYPYPF